MLNLRVTADGVVTYPKHRTSTTDGCATDGCWDYAAGGNVELIGKACDDIAGTAGAAIDALVGCPTVSK
jgi:hypothetical protein